MDRSRQHAIHELDVNPIDEQRGAAELLETFPSPDAAELIRDGDKNQKNAKAKEEERR